ncbi:hypothetical protein HII31_06581 [Pseudocercospora fuligena]|uniref:Transcription factor domain-containing protein n=1 Tax=Pseudocercospora fuligena TaxID=685502 RepID=A0A8H6RI12_9PEZI|nr:hypothetical protein HII31_06581 [Pseudocercospora fuligena]
MQTPPDSDEETRFREVATEDEANTKDLAAYADESSLPRHGSQPFRTPSSATKDRQLIRRQRKAHKNPLTPESAKHAPPLLVYKPTAAATRLRTELVDMMVRTQRNDIWFQLVPSRIGHDDAVDAAAKAIVKASDLAAKRTNVSQDSCLSSYGRAITSLRDNMAMSASADDTLLAVALLVTFERLFSWTSAPLRSHMHGIAAILMAQATSTKPPSDLSCALMYTFWPIAFIGPCVMGTPSPFECPRWLDAEPVPFSKEKMKAPWPPVGRLRKLSNQHFIRLPRLIVLVKSIQSSPNPEDIEKAVLLAKDLLKLEDKDAESELLHHVNIQKMESPATAEITPYVMNFSTITEYEAAMHYWSTRIFLLRLCWRLSSLFPKKYSEHDLPAKTEVQAQISRMAANVLMACHWATDKDEAGNSCCILDLVAVWGVLNDFDVFAARGLSPAKARLLLRIVGQQIMSITNSNAFEESGQRLEAAAELFVGGQSSGILAFTFKKPG